MKRSILRQIRTKRDEVIIGAGLGQDCAIVSFSGEAGSNKDDTYVMISCTQEGALDRGISPVLQKCVNVLAARGGEPVSLSVTLLLPVDFEEERLKRLTAEAEDFCRPLQVQIAEARGRVSEDILNPYAVATACGKAPARGDAAGDFHTVRAAKPGQDIVLSKWIGLEGTAVLAGRHRESLLERYPAWLVEEAETYGNYLSTVREAAAAVRAGAHTLHNVSEGGIFAALWELAEGAGTGLTVDLRKLPLKQATVEICNHCNVNPYELLSGGCLLMTCGDGARLKAAMEAEGIPAVVVGKLTGGRDRLILNEDEVRYLDRPHVDAVYHTEEK